VATTDNAPPAYLNPFVLPVPEVMVERSDIDLYVPAAEDPVPMVILVHGGPVAEDADVTPRDWPVYAGYGSLLAAGGVMAVMLDHPLHSGADYANSAGTIIDVINRVRRDPRIDPDRVGLWFFSAGGLLLADWLREPPPWLRCLAATYPVLATPPDYGIDARFRPVEAAGAYTGPLVLTRVGQERPNVNVAVSDFLSALNPQARLTLIEVPHGHHGFDHLDNNDESRDAIRRAVAAVISSLVDGQDGLAG
jgi:acetyl esterase/lipase